MAAVPFLAFGGSMSVSVCTFLDLGLCLARILFHQKQNAGALEKKTFLC